MFLVTGAKGQLGLCIKDLLAEKAAYLDVDTLDITDEVAVLKLTKEAAFTGIINCAAYTNVDKAENEPALAEKVNAQGPANLAKLAAELDIPLVHISTDYVFDGKACSPLTETDAVSPLGVYGRTKLAGEENVLKYAKTAAIIRTAWLYSPYGKNFVKTMLALGGTRPQIKVVSDQVGTPTYAPHLAAAILEILPQIKKGTKEIYHYTDAGVASWYDFAFYAIKQACLPAEVLPIMTKDYPTKATRPAYSVLSKEKIMNTFNLTLHHWSRGVKSCVQKLS
ncbi:MAG: dTDP-4-dehydrorhamnose reductase [Elusimicrobiaceae bacterium]|nr:dTDP-4-dehydrorhamnose reductase [Elusimicrobiaceae bacterium]